MDIDMAISVLSTFEELIRALFPALIDMNDKTDQRSQDASYFKVMKCFFFKRLE